MAETPDVLRKARTQLVLRRPFFATIVLGLEQVEVQKGQMLCDTMGTDGKRLYYVRDYVEKLTLEECLGVLVHEAMHTALMHPFRMKLGAYNPAKANICQDLAVNILVKEDSFILPGQPITWTDMMTGKTGWLYDPQYKDLSWEAIYRKLPDPPESPSCGKCGGKDSNGDGKCDQCGGKMGQGGFNQNTGRKGLGRDVISNDNPADETEAKISVSNAATIARQQGKLPAGMEFLLKDLLEPKIAWFDVLRHWMKSKRKDDYDPRRYNRRMTQFGVYLPTLYSEGLGPMVVVRDTSGSTMGDQESFLAEIAGIMTDAKPDKVWLVDCDARVDRVKEYTYNEGEALVQEAKEFHGGGGTSFKPPFKWVAKENIKPEVLVYLTDMYGDFPKHDPGYPVMWVSCSEIQEAPFGMVLPIRQ
jgi:predicted metal-dependent peptidase